MTTRTKLMRAIIRSIQNFSYKEIIITISRLALWKWHKKYCFILFLIVNGFLRVNEFCSSWFYRKKGSGCLRASHINLKTKAIVDCSRRCALAALRAAQKGEWTWCASSIYVDRTLPIIYDDYNLCPGRHGDLERRCINHQRILFPSGKSLLLSSVLPCADPPHKTDIVVLPSVSVVLFGSLR